MELVRGRTLEQELRERGPLPASEVASIGVQLCGALDAVHRAGLVHRDVKASNVMRDADGRLVLMDFGTGLEIGEAASDLAGTPLYIAPEVMHGDAVSPRSDIYSAGVLLYFLTTGRYPVVGRSLPEIRRAHETDAGDLRLPETPIPLATVIRRALARDPADRFQSAAAMGAALLVTGGDVPRPAPRGRIALIVAAVVVGVAAGGYQVWQSLEGQRQSTDVPQRICEYCGGGPATVSADGRWTAEFESRRHLQLRSLMSEDVRRVEVMPETVKGFAQFPVFSPDGRRIAFTWFADRAELRVVAIDGGSASQIVGAFTTAVTPVGWHPNGTNLLVVANRPERASALEWISVISGERWIFRELGWRGGTSDRPAISPDGKFVVYSALPANPSQPPPAVNRGSPPPPPRLEQHLYIRASDGSSEDALVNAAAVNRAPLWSADGRRVLFVSNQSGTQDVWSIRVREGRAESSAVSIWSAASGIEPLKIDPDGEILYSTSRPVPRRVSILPVAAGAAGEPIKEIAGGRAAWSPDGGRIALMRTRSGGGNAVDIVIHDVSRGSEQTIRLDGLNATGPPIWFSGSDALLVEMNIEPRPATPPFTTWSRIYLDDQPPEVLAPNRGDPKFVTNRGIKTLSPDGTTLYLGTYDADAGPISRISALHLGSQRYRDVFRLPGSLQRMPTSASELAIAVSPDGRSLAIQSIDWETDRMQLVRVDVDGTNYRVLCADRPAPPAIRERLIWTRTGETIFFTEGDDDGNFRVMRIAAAGGVPEFTGISRANLEVLDVSPDGKNVLVSSMPLNIPELWRRRVSLN
jgi:Tol biopolymer transport system component